MPIDRLQLSKLLELLQKPRDRRQRFIESDAKRSVLREKLGLSAEARDFYGPFWADAKQSVVDDKFDLAAATSARIEASTQRKALHPRLLSGFTSAWSVISARIDLSKDRSIAKGVSGTMFDAGEGAVQVANLLVIKSASGLLSVSYPYFSKEAGLGPRNARLGLAALRNALSLNNDVEASIIDVLRGNVFLDGDVSFSGGECGQLEERYDMILREWRNQRRIHGGR